MTLPEIEFKDIYKRFGSIIANDHVSFSVQSNSIHGVVGENGAGKSTIMKILYGLIHPDSGEIWVRGKKTDIRNPIQAIEQGIGMVHQHFMLVQTLTVWENVILGHEGGFRIRVPKCIEQLETLQRSFGLSLDLRAKIGSLPLGHQQQVEILKLLYRKAKILILDEPTAVLTPQEVEILFDRLRNLRQSGHTLILITHKLSEILRFTENVTIMRDGKVVESGPTSTLTEHSLATKIVGRQLVPLSTTRKPPSSSVVLRLNSVKLVRNPGKKALDGVSMEIHGGEILGIAGVEGNGQSELVELLAHVNEKYEGSYCIDDKDVRERTTYALKQKELALIPSDRQSEGLVLNFTLLENMIIGHHREAQFTRGAFLSNTKMSSTGAVLLERFDVRPRILSARMSSLSGGNQQKAILARELSQDCRLVVAAHPTRGVDIGAIETIHSLLLSLRNNGVAIALISSELDEILALSDRIVVLFEGKIRGEVARSNAKIAELGLWMTGGTVERH